QPRSLLPAVTSAASLVRIEGIFTAIFGATLKPLKACTRHQSYGMDDLEPLLGRTLVLVAHQDDETIGCGALLQRMRDPLVVFGTDGAPRDQKFWHGLGTR